MRLPLSARLVLSYLAVILVGMGIITPLAWLAVERLYLNTQKASLLAQAKVVASALQPGTPSMGEALPYSQTSNVSPGIHTRVLDAEGAVVIDLTAPGSFSGSTGLSLPQWAQNTEGVVSAEELLSRPEIVQALLGKPATAIRRVVVADGKRVLYAAAPVLSADGTVAQIVYLATPLPDTQWTALPVATRWLFVAVIGAAVLLAGSVGMLFARRISRPLGKLVAAAHAVSGGDLDQKVPEDPSITELSILGRAFNSMTDSLRQADQVKTAFISDVSHELRTPLTVIKGSIETLQDGALDDLSVRDSFLASMNRETDRLIRMVNDLLVLTRADAGALNLQFEPMDLEELARLRCASLERTATQRQVKLRVPHVPADRPFTVLADADRIAQVLDNLLDNAIRYSPPGGDVMVTLSRETNRIVCRVTDAGPGIPPAHLPLIFERFYRVDPARRHDQGGSGLGLSIVRELVLAHQGGVNAESIEGHGTTLTFWLPAVSS